MKYFLNYASSILMVLALVLCIVGGGYLRTEAFKVEIGSVDAWAVLSIIFSFLFYKIYKEKPITHKLMTRILCLLGNRKALFSLVLGIGFLVLVTHLLKHLNFQTHMYDMSFVNQALFNPFGEKLLACDVCKFGTYLGEHISFSLLLLSPLTALFQSNFLIYIIEILCLFVPIIYLIRNTTFAEKANYHALLFLVILCNRSLRSSLFWDFREDHLGFFFLLFSLIFLFKKKIKMYFVFLLLALFSKEHVGVITMFLAFPLFFEKELIENKRQRYLISGMTFALSLAVVIIDFKVFFPMFTVANQSKNNIVLRFGEFGNTPREIVLNVLTTPVHWITLLAKIVTKGSIKYIFLLFAPYFIFLKDVKWWFLPIFAGVGLNLLSPLGNERMMIFHYDLILLAITIFAMIYKAKEISLKKSMFAFVLALTFSGRWPLYYIKNFDFDNVRDAYFMSQIDKNNIIATKKQYLPHFSHFKGVRYIDHLNSKNGFNIDECSHPAQCVGQADLILLNIKEGFDQNIFNKLKNNWKVTSRSPSERMIVLKRND